MTSLRKRLENVLAELAIIREALDRSGHYPSCCLTVGHNGKISCDAIGPLPEKEFLSKCQKCQENIKKTIAHFNLNEIEKIK